MTDKELEKSWWTQKNGNEAIMSVEKEVRKWLTLILVANGLNHLFSDEYKQICLLVSKDGFPSEG